MALISLRQLLDHAAENGYGLPAFNVNNMEQVKAIMEAAAAVDSPVILQGSAGARSYAGEPFLRHLILAAIEMYPQIPICMHQDHGASPSICFRSIQSGFSSVMMDGSLKEDGKTPATYEYNVATTAKVSELAHACGVGSSRCVHRGETLVHVRVGVEDQICASGVEGVPVGLQVGVVAIYGGWPARMMPIGQRTVGRVCGQISRQPERLWIFRAAAAVLRAVRDLHHDMSRPDIVRVPALSRCPCRAPEVLETRRGPRSQKFMIADGRSGARLVSTP